MVRRSEERNHSMTSIVPQAKLVPIVSRRECKLVCLRGKGKKTREEEGDSFHTQSSLKLECRQGVLGVLQGGGDFSSGHVGAKPKNLKKMGKVLQAGFWGGKSRRSWGY